MPSGNAGSRCTESSARCRSEWAVLVNLSQAERQHRNVNPFGLWSALLAPPRHQRGRLAVRWRKRGWWRCGLVRDVPKRPLRLNVPRSSLSQVAPDGTRCSEKETTQPPQEADGRGNRVDDNEELHEEDDQPDQETDHPSRRARACAPRARPISFTTAGACGDAGTAAARIASASARRGYRPLSS